MPLPVALLAKQYAKQSARECVAENPGAPWAIGLGVFPLALGGIACMIASPFVAVKRTKDILLYTGLGLFLLGLISIIVGSVVLARCGMRKRDRLQQFTDPQRLLQQGVGLAQGLLGGGGGGPRAPVGRQSAMPTPMGGRPMSAAPQYGQMRAAQRPEFQSFRAAQPSTVGQMRAAQRPEFQSFREAQATPLPVAGTSMSESMRVAPAGETFPTFGATSMPAAAATAAAAQLMPAAAETAAAQLSPERRAEAARRAGQLAQGAQRGRGALQQAGQLAGQLGGVAQRLSQSPEGQALLQALGPQRAAQARAALQRGGQFAQQAQQAAQVGDAALARVAGGAQQAQQLVQ